MEPINESQFKILQVVVGTLIPLITFLIAFLFGLKQYRKAQKWKKQEFLANVIKDFFNDFYVGQTLSMLDWHEFDLKYSPEREKTFPYNREQLELAIETEDVRKIKRKGQKPLFEGDEIVIRISFDKFFYYLASFQCHIENGLYKKEDIEPYIFYYLRIIGDRDKLQRLNDATRLNLWDFLRFYDYIKVEKFLNGFGFDYEKVKANYEGFIMTLESEDKRLVANMVN